MFRVTGGMNISQLKLKIDKDSINMIGGAQIGKRAQSVGDLVSLVRSAEKTRMCALCTPLWCSIGHFHSTRVASVSIVVVVTGSLTKSTELTISTDLRCILKERDAECA